MAQSKNFALKNILANFFACRIWSWLKFNVKAVCNLFAILRRFCLQRIKGKFLTSLIISALYISSKLRKRGDPFRKKNFQLKKNLPAMLPSHLILPNPSFVFKGETCSSHSKCLTWGCHFENKIHFNFIFRESFSSEAETEVMKFLN